MTKTSTLIRVKDLVKRYRKVTVLNAVNLEVFSGEVFGLAGPNGAGKSTLISVIATLVRPTAGDVLIGGKSVSLQASEVKRLIGLVPQEVALYNRLSGMDNLQFWAQAYGLRGKPLRAAIGQAMEVTGLAARLNDPVECYSGGMKRRLNIAIALLHNPQILIMDEPTAGVDRESCKVIVNTVKQLSTQGVTVLYVTHNIDEMKTVCDRFAMLREGKVTALGTADELTDRFPDVSITNLNYGG